MTQLIICFAERMNGISVVNRFARLMGFVSESSLSESVHIERLRLQAEFEPVTKLRCSPDEMDAGVGVKP